MKHLKKFNEAISDIPTYNRGVDIISELSNIKKADMASSKFNESSGGVDMMDIKDMLLELEDNNFDCIINDKFASFTSIIIKKNGLKFPISDVLDVLVRFLNFEYSNRVEIYIFSDTSYFSFNKGLDSERIINISDEYIFIDNMKIDSKYKFVGKIAIKILKDGWF